MGHHGIRSGTSGVTIIIRALLLASSFLVLGLTIVVLPRANAMGDSPGTCSNLYPGTITRLVVTYPGGTLDVLAHPDTTITMLIGQTYDVDFTVHTRALNTNHTTAGGTLWYSEDVVGYAQGICYPSRDGTTTRPNQDVPLSMHDVSKAPNVSPGMRAQIFFESTQDLGSNNHQFGIIWSNGTQSTNTTTGPTITTATTTMTTSAVSTEVTATGTESSSSEAATVTSTSEASVNSTTAAQTTNSPGNINTTSSSSLSHTTTLNRTTATPSSASFPPTSTDILLAIGIIVVLVGTVAYFAGIRPRMV